MSPEMGQHLAAPISAPSPRSGLTPNPKEAEGFAEAFHVPRSPLCELLMSLLEETIKREHESLAGGPANSVSALIPSSASQRNSTIFTEHPTPHHAQGATEERPSPCSPQGPDPLSKGGPYGWWSPVCPISGSELRKKFPGLFSSIWAGGKGPLSIPHKTAIPPPTVQLIL